MEQDPLTLAGPVLPAEEDVLPFPLPGAWTTPAGLHEAAKVFLGDSSTAAFQISSWACNTLPHYDQTEITFHEQDV